LPELGIGVEPYLVGVTDASDQVAELDRQPLLLLHHVMADAGGPVGMLQDVGYLARE